MIQRSDHTPEGSFEADVLRQQIENAQDLGQISFLNTSSGLSLRITPRQNASGAIEAALEFEGDISGVHFSMEADADAHFFTSALRIEGKGGLSPQKITEFFQNHPPNSFGGFDEFRSTVNDQLGHIDSEDWLDLVSAMPMPVSEAAQKQVLAPMLEMGELGDVCLAVEGHLRACGWTSSEITGTFRADVREMRAARFRFQEMTTFSVASIHNAEQLRIALAVLDADPYEPDELNPFAAADRSEALRSFVVGQAKDGVDVREILTAIKPFWRDLSESDRQAVSQEIVNRGWSPAILPRIRFDDVA